VAIVVETVARSTNVVAPNTRLAKLVTGFVTDPAESVALWGLKAPT